MIGGWRLRVGLLGLVAVLGCGDNQRTPEEAAGGSGNNAGRAGSGGAPADQGGASTSDAGDASAAGQAGGCECEDGIACTVDDCSSGMCEHQALHFACPAGQYCSLQKGCTDGDACATDADCARPDACALASCDASTRRCVFAFLDGDQDGEAPDVCGGRDCNDDDAAIRGGTVEVCDGKDNDCDLEVDPPQASGCAADKSCLDATCVCDAPRTACADVGNACVDLQTDSAHCGSCYTACDDDEVCSAGDCVCAEGLSPCGSSCVDLTNDPRNCGTCGESCGNGECQEGGCVCPEPTQDCGTTDRLSCKDTGSDVQHCGGCDQRCLPVGACAEGRCDAQLGWVKMYGAYSSTRHLSAAQLAADAAGNLFVGFNGEATATIEMPDGEATLWSSASIIARFDAEGDPVWVKPSSAAIDDVAVIGSDLWALAFVTESTPNVTIAGQAFAMREGYEAYTALIKLRGSDGAVLDYFQLDHTVWNTANYPFLFHDEDQLWVAGNTRDLRRDATTWNRPSTVYGAYVYPLGGAPLWLPGRMLEAGLDAAGKLVVSVEAPTSSTFTFGGDTYTIGSYATQGVARYSQEFVHEASYIRERSTGSRLAMGMSTLTLVDEYEEPFFQQTSDTGAVINTVGDGSTPFRPYSIRAQGGQLFMIGNGSSGAETLFGRATPGGYPSMLLAFDAQTLALQRAVGFDAELHASYGVGGVQDFAIVDGGAAVVLAIAWETGLSIGDFLVDIGTDYRGLALARIELPAL